MSYRPFAKRLFKGGTQTLGLKRNIGSQRPTEALLINKQHPNITQTGRPA